MGMLLRRYHEVNNTANGDASSVSPKAEPVAHEKVAKVEKVEKSEPIKVVEDKKPEPKNINKMSVTELRKLAKEQGIKNAELKTGAELKKLLSR